MKRSVHNAHAPDAARTPPVHVPEHRPTSAVALHALTLVWLQLGSSMPASGSDAAVPASAPARGVVELHDARGDDRLRLSPPRAGSPRRTPLGAGWRHDLDIVLTLDDGDRVVRDGNQLRHVFPTTNAAGEPTSDPRASGGEIAVRDGHPVWTRASDGADIAFRGSLPVKVTATDGRETFLRYADGRLVEVARDGRRGTTRFAYERGRLSDVTFPDGTAHALRVRADGTLTTRRYTAVLECDPEHPAPADAAESERDAEDRCDTASNPPPPSFTTSGVPGATRVDARPASCESYFVEHVGTERGTEIEAGLVGLPHYAGYDATVRSFPVVDFVGRELRVVRSRDLSLPSYDAVPDGLFDRLLRDGDDIVRGLLEPLARDGLVAASESGRTTVVLHRPERAVVLELVVRHGIASADQKGQIRRAAAELLARHGIRLRVVEIP